MRHHHSLNRWDDYILRIIAIYHLLKAAFFFGLGFGLLHLVHQDIALLINDYLVEPFKLAPDGKILKGLLEWTSGLTPHWLRLISYLFICYGSIFALEGLGLYLRKRWAEFMVVIVVSSLLPFEIYEICLCLAWWKFLLLLGNIFIVTFLVRRLVIEATRYRNFVEETACGFITRVSNG
jgi:uncharacterized membrane protein (DUF2068 family)